MDKFKLGLVSVSFRRHTAEEILAEMKKTKLSCIEWGSDIHAPKDDKDKLMNIKQLQEAYGIACSSYGTYFRLGTDPVEELCSYIEAARVLGASVLRLWCGDKNSGEYEDAEKDKLMGECKKAAQIAQQEQVLLCMECHNNTYTDTKESALELMQCVDSPYFRMYWQPNQLRTEEENRISAQVLSDYVENVHVFQWKGQEKFSLESGIAEWRSYIKQFSKKHTLLLEFMPDDHLESLEREAKALAVIAG